MKLLAQITKQVSVAVRILQRNRDESARASHLVVKKGSLMTYERAVFGQAGSGNVSGSTFSERKNMSTKTSFKRIALVAATALALGGLSAVSAYATAGQAISTTTGTITGTPGVAGASILSSVTTGTYSVETVTSGAADHVYTITSTGVGSMSIAAAPAVGYTSAAIVNGDQGGAVITSAGLIQNYVVNGSTSATWYAGTTPGIVPFGGTGNTFQFAAYSTVAGTQVITVTGDVSGSVTHSITWGASPVVSASNSAVYIAPVATYSSGSNTEATAAALALGVSASTPVLAVKTAATSYLNSSAAVATVFVKLKNNSTPAGALTGQVVSASVSGSGLVDGNSVAGGTYFLNSPAKGASSVTDANGYAAFQVYADGTAGTSTITVTYTDSAGVVTTLGSPVTAVFYGGTPASFTVTQNTAVGAAGSEISASGVNVATNGHTGDGALTVSAKDSLGNPVAGLLTAGNALAGTAGWTVTSDNTACVTNTVGTIAQGTASSATDNPLGTYEIDLMAASGAASGCVANVTLGYYISSTTAALTSTPVKVTIGKTTIASLSLATDATDYAPGSKVKYLLTAKGSDGNPVADGYYGIITSTGVTTAVSGLSLNASLPSTPWAAAAAAAPGWAGIYFVSGVATASTYAPYYSGTVVGTLTVANTTSLTGIAAALEATTYSTSFVVDSPTDAASNAAADAAAEATDAANAATDAANAAADSADQATAAAQDAGSKADAALAAVTALSQQVTTLLSKIAALTAAVAKIAKKVKA